MRAASHSLGHVTFCHLGASKAKPIAIRMTNGLMYFRQAHRRCRTDVYLNFLNSVSFFREHARSVCAKNNRIRTRDTESAGPSLLATRKKNHSIKAHTASIKSKYSIDRHLEPLNMRVMTHFRRRCSFEVASSNSTSMARSLVVVKRQMTFREGKRERHLRIDPRQKYASISDAQSGYGGRLLWHLCT